MTAGPAFCAATVPVSTKMPVPMMPPTPSAVRCQALRVRFRLVSLGDFKPLPGYFNTADPFQGKKSHAGTVMGEAQQIDSPLVEHQGMRVNLVGLGVSRPFFCIHQVHPVLMEQRPLQTFDKYGRG